jgi:hypothetical protein
MRYAIYGSTEDVSATTDGAVLVAAILLIEDLEKWVTALIELGMTDVEAVSDAFAALSDCIATECADLGAAVEDLLAALRDLLLLIPMAVSLGLIVIGAEAFIVAGILVGINALATLLPQLRAADIEQWLVEKFVRPVLCPPEGVQIGTVTLPEVMNAMPALKTKCLRATAAVDLTSGCTFEFLRLNDDLGELGVGGNHGFISEAGKPSMPFGGRVWISSIELDVAAVAYDYLVSLAVRHYAWAQFKAASAPNQGSVEEHLTAAGVCLRMALSVVADYLGTHMVHETTHNVGLWHCGSEVLGFESECIQDGVAYSWWAHATATLGLGTTSWDPNPSSAPGTVHLSVGWSPSLHGHAGWSGDPDTSATSPSARWVSTNADQPYLLDPIECSEGGKAEATDFTAVNTALTVFAMIDPATSEILRMITLALEWDLGPGILPSSAKIVFTIDRPLQIGGKVLGCCFVQGPGNCCSEEGHPCWETDGPEGYDPGCCESSADDSISSPDPGTGTSTGTTTSTSPTGQ